VAVAANSYGTAAGVAALTPRWAAGDDFVSATRPTLAQVEAWIDQVSSVVNSFLAESGFSIPVTDTDVINSVIPFIEQEVASIVEGVNGAGRFGPTAKPSGKRGRWALIMDDAETFVKANAAGFERLGATRAQDFTDSVAVRSTDEVGDTINPIFQRKQYGNAFQNWDQ